MRRKYIFDSLWDCNFKLPGTSFPQSIDARKPRARRSRQCIICSVKMRISLPSGKIQDEITVSPDSQPTKRTPAVGLCTTYSILTTICLYIPGVTAVGYAVIGVLGT